MLAVLRSSQVEDAVPAGFQDGAAWGKTFGRGSSQTRRLIKEAVAAGLMERRILRRRDALGILRPIPFWRAKVG